MEPKMEQPRQYTPEEIAQLEKSRTISDLHEKEKFSALRVCKVVLLVALWPIGIIYLFSLLPKFIIGPSAPTKRHPLLVSFVQVWSGLVILLFMVGFIFTGHSADNLLPDGLLLKFILLLIIPISPALFILWRDSGREKQESYLSIEGIRKIFSLCLIKINIHKLVIGLAFTVFIVGIALLFRYFFHEYFVILTLATLAAVILWAGPFVPRKW